MSSFTLDVFISYSHDSTQHEERVLALADRLRTDGISAMIDQYQTAPPEGWQLWMQKLIRDAKFVLVVCTETYQRRVMKEEAQGKGLGVLWESTIIYSHLYSAGVVNEKFIPIYFESGDIKHIPVPLQPTTYYDVSTDEGYERLYRRLTEQPETPAPSLGKRRVLLPRQHLTSRSPDQPLTQLPPNLVHPYPLQANFTGRVTERKELSAWFKDDAHPICALIAMGGMGKSALSWYWIKNDVLSPTQESSASTVKGVMWWSFYEGESSFAKFIDEALGYVSNQPIDATLFPTTYDRAQELRKQLQTKRILFVLDGFERQLRAYARLDAAYHQDDTADSSRKARACVDPIAGRWLKDIAAGTTRAKVLLTTRLMVNDLEDQADNVLEGVFKRELEELPRDDAVAFMRRQGVVTGLDTAIANVCDTYGNHPLSLRLLSGLIARDARTPGDIAAAPRHDVYDDLVQRQHHVLEQSYNALTEKERALLSRIAAFRNPMLYDALAIFNEYDDESKFDEVLYDLQARGLLQRDIAHNRYDLHPIVRRYCYDRLTDKTGVHTRLSDYFAKIPTPDENNVRSIEDIAPVIELYHHTARAGHYDKALELFRNRLADLLFYRLGAYQTLIELLRALFPNGEENPPQIKDELDRAWTLNQLANPYGFSGQPRRALQLYEQAIPIWEKSANKNSIVVGLLAVSILAYIPLGQLEIAEQFLRRTVKVSAEIKNAMREARGHQELGRLLALRSAFDEAEKEFESALELLGDALQDQWWKGTSWLYRAQSALLRHDVPQAIEAAREAHRLKDIEFPGIGKVERDIIVAEWLLGASSVMEGKSLGDAYTHLTEALTRCRRINLVEIEPDILLALAHWYRAQRNAQEAQAHAEEALAIADRSEYRLKQAEIHNFLAHLALDAGNREAAREHAETARERAWCDGPPYCYKPALDEATGMLKELGVKE